MLEYYKHAPVAKHSHLQWACLAKITTPEGALNDGGTDIGSDYMIMILNEMLS